MITLNKKLQDLRNDVDVVDALIVSLLGKRGRIAQKICKLKRENHLPVTNHQREKHVIAHVCQRAQLANVDETFVTQLFRLIMSESKRCQEMIAHEK